jgi:phosphomannomutase
MAETGAQLAGEMSGHLFIDDHSYGFDDALYAACRLLRASTTQDMLVARCEA